ncbi:MAG: YqzL family protein [Firmicutes bacterium]|nr:YqzL family protein [Bacillota bacterium]
MKKYFWDLFEHTGNIDAYLAYKDMQNISERTGERFEQTESTGHRY